ncbi:hypothetical protein DL96DRAFT_1212855 [Flagelloscypha sp. PMI_526]|nr:hypothetical protein DL96DRAFT_1212855 [Flagelloscypha sp. PMI_526]
MKMRSLRTFWLSHALTDCWSCCRSTPIPTTPVKISFLSFSCNHVIAALGPWNSCSFALIDLRYSGAVTYLLNEDGAKFFANKNTGTSARFSREHVVIFHYPSADQDLRGNIYSMQSTTQVHIRPITVQKFPAGTKSVVFSHITTQDLAFSMLITPSLQSRKPI